MHQARLVKASQADERDQKSSKPDRRPPSIPQTIKQVVSKCGMYPQEKKEEEKG
jgi:hypothetical protein